MKTRENRQGTFQQIRKALSKHVRAQSDNAVLVEGDSLHLLRNVPGKSISLILTDPPYHSTRKQNVHGDTSFADDQKYLDWMAQYISEWRRILRDNGSIYCFCSSAMASRLEVLFRDRFNVLSQIVWTKPNDPGFDGWKQKMKKEALRQWYEHTERIIFAEPATEGNLFRSSLGKFLRDARIECELSGHELTKRIGAYGKVNHGGAVSNWEAGRNVPSREQYRKICQAFIATGKVKSLPAYEDVVRPFATDSSKEFTDVWNFPSVRPYKGKHPAEKPLSLLEHAIEATTYPGDIVLDCFAGSGCTQLAANNLGRRAISMEIDPHWVERIASLFDKKAGRITLSAVQKNRLGIKDNVLNQQPLFSE
jgi:site-specific DNA-methyltransferase (adenine-specific)